MPAGKILAKMVVPASSGSWSKVSFPCAVVVSLSFGQPLFNKLEPLSFKNFFLWGFPFKGQRGARCSSVSQRTQKSKVITFQAIKLKWTKQGKPKGPNRSIRCGPVRGPRHCHTGAAARCPRCSPAIKSPHGKRRGRWSLPKPVVLSTHLWVYTYVSIYIYMYTCT